GAVALGKWKLAASAMPLPAHAPMAGTIGRIVTRLEESHRALAGTAAGLALLGLVILGAKLPGHGEPTRPPQGPVAQATTSPSAEVQGTSLAATPLPVVRFTELPDLGGGSGYTPSTSGAGGAIGP